MLINESCPSKAGYFFKSFIWVIKFTFYVKTLQDRSITITISWHHDRIVMVVLAR